MIEHIKRVVSEFMAGFTSTKYGQISAYNPDDYTVKVLIMPTLQETGFVPLSAPWVGNGFGTVFGPAVGDAVRLDFVDGNVEATVVGARFFNNGARPPVVQSGQAAIVDSKGSYIKLNNDGTISINAATAMNFSAQTIVMQATQTVSLIAGTEVTNSAPTIELDGQLTQGKGPNGGNAAIEGPLNSVNDVVAGGISTINHYHSNSGGSGNGGPPVPGS